MRRASVNKRASAKSFNARSGRVHPKNMIYRGGYRLS